MATRYLESSERIGGKLFETRVCRNIKLTRSYYVNGRKVTMREYTITLQIARNHLANQETENVSTPK